MTDHLRHMPEFFEAVRARMMKGVLTYEDKSFSKRPEDLIEELKQEALDLAGWGFILFSRLQGMAEAIEASRDQLEVAHKQPIPSSTRIANPTGRESARKRVGALLGALREAHGIEGDLLADLIQTMTSRDTVGVRAPELEAQPIGQLPSTE